MNANTKHEIEAIAFNLMTGILAPGKDLSDTCNPIALQERTELWLHWKQHNGLCITAVITAFESVGQVDAVRICMATKSNKSSLGHAQKGSVGVSFFAPLRRTRLMAITMLGSLIVAAGFAYVDTRLMAITMLGSLIVAAGFAYVAVCMSKARNSSNANRTANDQSNARPLRPTIIQSCDCEGFRKGIGIWFDSQDLRDHGYTDCPACKKPFKVEIR